MIMICRTLPTIVILSLSLTGCEQSSRTKVLFENVDPATGLRMVAATQKVRAGGEGWDLFISIKSSSGVEIARSTITSLDTPRDVGLGVMEVVGMTLDTQKQQAEISFKNGKSIGVPVVLRVDEGL